MESNEAVDTYTSTYYPELWLSGPDKNYWSQQDILTMLKQLGLTVFLRGSGCCIYIKVFGDSLVSCWP